MNQATHTTAGESTVRRDAPRLSQRALIALLAVMCLVPIVVVLVLWRLLPPVQAGQLPCRVELADVPPPSIYDLPIGERPVTPAARVIITNLGDEPWTNINVRINREFYVYELHRPLEPGHSMEFYVDRFVSRNGAPFEVRFVRIREVEVYARLSSKARATFTQAFDDEPPAHTRL
jgi:hypothetical protein